MESQIIIIGIAGIVFGGIVGWLISANRTRARLDLTLQQSRDVASSARGEATALDARIKELRQASEERSKQAAADFKKLRDDLSAESEAKVKAETEAAEMKKNVEEQRSLLSEAESKFKDTFKALAGDALTTTNQKFLELANATFEKVLIEAKGDIGKKQQAIDELVKPLTESLMQFDGHVRKVELLRESAYAGLIEQIKSLNLSQTELKRETGNLVSALSVPQVRGRWGEMTLRRVVELAGMSEHCDFSEQVSADTENGRQRPDMIVNLPSGRQIVIDAKVSLVAYHRAVSASTEEERKTAFGDHAKQTRIHMRSLGAKSYWQRFTKAPEFVVMFIAGESFFAAAAHHDHELIEDGMSSKVVLATPTTLIALLQAVAYGWKQEQLAESAQIICQVGTQLHDRMRVLVEHIGGIGKGLEKANTAYNDAVGSIERRVLPAARRIKELGAGSGDDIPQIETIESLPKRIGALELDQPESSSSHPRKLN